MAVAAVAALVLTALAVLAGGAQSAPGQPAANLDQCRNGGFPGTAPCTGSNWVNGNAGAANAHYVEGYSIPYRAVLTNLPTDGTVIELTLGYDSKHSDKHALDFLTHFDRLEPHAPFGHAAEDVDPTSGVSGLGGPTTTLAIPEPSSAGSPVAGQPGTRFNALPAGERLMTLFGGTLTTIEYDTQGDLTAAQSETRVTVSFTAQSDTAVLSWGAHIARSTDWGALNSASVINGSPYHMRLIDWNLNNLGNQDRSLSAGAVFGMITIAKTAVGGDGTFGYTTTGANGLPSSFDITTSGGSGSAVYAIVGGKTYTVTEASLPAGWDFDDLECSDPTSNSTVDLGTRTATIVANNGESITCTFTNRKQPKLTLVKQVVNDSGGTAEASAWTLTASGPTGFSGSGPSVSSGAGFGPGTYDLSEAGPDGYDASAWVCSAGQVDGDTVSVAFGDDITCTITNDDQPAKLVVIKTVVNDNGGTKLASDFALEVSGNAPSPASFAGAA
ncbi:MAG TPA: hypothetical protein VI540_05960, partial [Gaiellaceae bacterium]|nr:hypothetical protein [Gaiellaceae bacterium]